MTNRVKQAYSKPFQISKMECFVKIVNGYIPLTMFAERSILDDFSVLNTPLLVAELPSIYSQLE